MKQLIRPDSPLAVRLIRLPPAGPALVRARLLLDEDEERRLAGLRHQPDRDQFTAAHAALRLLLAPYLGRDPAAIRFDRAACPRCRGPHGRPVVRGGPSNLHFSLSRRPGIAACAIATQPVGIDIEALDRPIDLEDLDPALHPAERRALASLPPAARRTAALRCWVRKEAYLKGTGTGLGVDPSDVEVGVDSPTGPHEGPDDWLLADLPPDLYTSPPSPSPPLRPAVVPTPLRRRTGADRTALSLLSVARSGRPQRAPPTPLEA